MVCVKVVSTPVEANLNSQYIASQQIFEFKCQEIQSETLTRTAACVKYVVLKVVYSVNIVNNVTIDHLDSVYIHASCLLYHILVTV